VSLNKCPQEHNKVKLCTEHDRQRSEATTTSNSPVPMLSSKPDTGSAMHRFHDLCINIVSEGGHEPNAHAFVLSTSFLLGSR
jgi:hypothetical protein